MIKLDFKFMKLPLIMYLSATAVFLITLLASPDTFYPSEKTAGVYESNAFFFIDFLLPFFASACIIMQLGGTMEKRTFDFFCSLPVRMSPILRWILSMIMLLIVHFGAIIATYFTLGKYPNFKMSFLQMCFTSFANFMIFCSLALILVLIFRRIFYIFSILYGYLLIDLIIGDNLLGSKSVFVNIFAQCSKDAIGQNRIVLYCISAALIVISAILLKCDFLRRINKHL